MLVLWPTVRVRTDAGKVVTFKGKLAQRRGQAAFLTFCVFLSMSPSHTIPQQTCCTLWPAIPVLLISLLKTPVSNVPRSYFVGVPKVLPTFSLSSPELGLTSLIWPQYFLGVVLYADHKRHQCSRFSL